MKKLFLALAIFSIIGSMINLHGNYHQKQQRRFWNSPASKRIITKRKNCLKNGGSWNTSNHTCSYNNWR